MTGRIFYFISALIFLLGAFVMLAPSLLTCDLIFPDRIDSTYVAFHEEQYLGIEDSLLFNPSDVGLQYDDIVVKSNEGFKLRGWFIHAADSPAHTLMIIHDVNESRILYLDYLKQFHDRGFNVAIFDLRAHGSSGGREFTPGLPAVDDVKQEINAVLKLNVTRHLVLMGIGVGAAIALQSAVYDDHIAGLVLQSPFNNYTTYLDHYSTTKWGFMKNVWYPVLKRRTSELLHYPLKELDLTEIAKYISVPSLFIIAAVDKKVASSETLQVFYASATEKKELFLVRNTEQESISEAGGEAYFNRIAAYLNFNLPKETKTTRYKKLALNDY